ncbi:Fic/DOC family N-terminal domain-containing protein [Dyadobacter luticola]|uniref:Cell filamentation protein Fic n=1 Tax=Dyadobacter luticola TaxID=1979387 RepID=A0A5R9KW68_9BACT|nr:Fic/DOC family N-terminal domain-containing protein [Dyadobacter luticola]TLV00421.1 cell filamentation protein Fic [Dyadobacter luticola]
MNYKIALLPFDIDLETKPVLKKVAAARAALAELKGAVASIPNEAILISTLSLQEAKDMKRASGHLQPGFAKQYLSASIYQN